MIFLLDTDTCIALLRGVEGAVEKARLHSPGDFAVSAITRYELMYGVARCNPDRRVREREKVEIFLSALHELPFTGRTAGLAAEIRSELERRGQSIGPMDILIAATAREGHLELVTGTLGEFSRIPGFSCRFWR